MTPTSYLQGLKDKGVLDALYREGMISHMPYTVLEVRQKTDGLMRQGRSKVEAVAHIASTLGVSVRMVYKYLAY